MIEAICNCEEGYSVQSPRAFYSVRDLFVAQMEAGVDVVVSEVVELEDLVYTGLCYLAFSIFNGQHDLVKTSRCTR